MKRPGWVTLSLIFLAVLSGCATEPKKGVSAFESGDFATALSDLATLAQSGNPTAQVHLGIMYVRGWGVTPDHRKAVSLWQEAAKKNNPRALYDIGLNYSYGGHVPRSDTEAIKWWRKAAALGYPDAMRKIGEAYLNGTGVVQNREEASLWLNRAHKSYLALGNDAPPRFHSNLGRMYRKGIGVVKDPTKAFHWYRKAAERGYATAQYQLGLIYLLGRGTARNAEEAKKWFLKASDWYHKVGNQGGAWAAFRAGDMHRLGRGLARDREEAKKWWHKAIAAYELHAEQGDVTAQHRLGYIFRNSLLRDYDKSFSWTKKAAETGFPQSQRALAQMYQFGRGTERNLSEAARWFRKSAEQADLTSQKALARLYQTGNGVPKDFSAAIRWYQAAAEQGDGSSQLRLVEIYSSDKYAAKDKGAAHMWLNLANAQLTSSRVFGARIRFLNKIESEMAAKAIAEAHDSALRWLKKYQTGSYEHSLQKWLPAATGGDAKAQYELGRKHAHGDGIPKNYRLAFEWLEKSAEQGNPKAQNALGYMYAEGKGTEQSHKTAHEWIKRAAAQGNVEAKFNLGALYRAGHGIPKDKTQSLKWFSTAARAGFHHAQYNLGIAHENGDGITQDSLQAYAWYSLAASNGNSDAAKSREKIAKNMKPEQILAAQKLSNQWLTENLSETPVDARSGNAMNEHLFVLKPLTLKGSGTGFYVTKAGLILTTNHVIDGCREIVIQTPGQESLKAKIVAQDATNDIALLKAVSKSGAMAVFQAGSRLAPGDEIVSFGFPLSQILASAGNLTTGQVSSLSGIRDDSRHFQITAPLQQGNSGGPILNAYGKVVGMASGKLRAFAVALVTGDIPQNVNFAIKGKIIETFLEANRIKFQRNSVSTPKLSTAESGARAKKYTIKIACWQ
jgi:TPR repeat protein